jgi:hypothetical protein
MLKLPVKVVLVLCGILLIVLGAHGLWVYTHRADIFGRALLGESVSMESYGSRLFLSVGLPSPFRGLVWWASQQGGGDSTIFPLGGSWFVPSVLIVGGIILLAVQQGISVRSSRFVRRMKHKLWD